MKRNATLWVIQGLLAALFLFAGSMKLILPIEAMAGPVRCRAGSCGSSAWPRWPAPSASFCRGSPAFSHA